MGLGDFGTALDAYLNKKKAYKAIDDLDTQNKQSQQIGDAQSRTQQWLSSLSPEELTKMGGSKTSDYSLPKNDFNYDDKARDIQLKYGDVEGINDYFKSVQDSRVKSSLEDATKGMQREKQFADLQALEEKAGIPKGDYNIRSNRQVALDSGLPKFAGDQRVKDFMETYVEKPELASSKWDTLNAQLGQKDKELAVKEELGNSRLQAQKELADAKSQMQRELFDQKFENQKTLQDERLRVAQEEGEKNRLAKGNQMKPEERLSNAENVIDKINVIANHPGFKSSVGLKGFTRLGGILPPLPGSKDAGFEAEFNALRSMLTMENIGKLKGVLSDTDMKILAQAASSLDTNMPEPDFIREMNRVKKVMENVKNGSKYSDQAVQEAQEALNDPDAPESVKRAARKVLGQ